MKKMPDKIDELGTDQYHTVLQRLNSFSSSTGFPVQPICELSVNGHTYPIVKIDLNSGHSKKKTMLISAGIHGDEPAGVEAICTFLQSGEFQKYERDWELTFLPCLNPYGYKYGTRNNHADNDLNRLFKSASPPLEVVAAQETLRRPFDVTLELHEDSESPGYYLYHKETVPSSPPLGRLVLQAVETVMPINTNPEIEGMPAERGLIGGFSSPEKMDWWPMALYAADMGTRSCFTLETSPHFSMEIRMKAHLSAIRMVLENHSG